jgi:hypothetical protein
MTGWSRRTVGPRFLGLTMFLGVFGSCASSHQFQRTCGPISVIQNAKGIDLRVNDLRECNAGRNKRALLTRRLEDEIKRHFREMRFGEQYDLIVIVSVSDKPRGCILPSSNWTIAIDAWLPTRKSPTGGTFAEILEIQGRTKLGGDFVHEAIDQFAAVKEGRASLPPSRVRCVFGLDATP